MSSPLPARCQVHIYLCLLDVAGGMRYLHSQGIMHSGKQSCQCKRRRRRPPQRRWFCHCCTFAQQLQTTVATDRLPCSPDLKPANVLLKSSRSSVRGYTCKLADFGLSRWAGGRFG